ncbi:hypothetical protein [Spirosoma sordidisoli]|uniref:Uncharacterized protein n=1 Tax=Spirosoma sordidisoli TaxID=2502893 RepID=A0A4Q2UST7_9BACT|nr:hypothetical protein [Spirosoma sordidisoli]RYC70845.1 hypothetical protein EQG79_01455 [Spirosoma sordidisoli]
MNEFLQELATALNGFPPILIVLLAPFCGSLAACIVVGIAGGPDADSPGKIAGQFVVGWLAGAFGGPLLAPIFNAPAYTIGFVAGASGYWGIKVYLKKKQDEILNKPGGPGNP